MFESHQRAIRGVFTVIKCIESYLNGRTATGRIARAQFEAVMSAVAEASDPSVEQLVILPSLELVPGEDLPKKEEIVVEELEPEDCGDPHCEACANRRTFRMNPYVFSNEEEVPF
jgi:hypothetical protein